jgi:hypothetical protein
MKLICFFKGHDHEPMDKFGRYNEVCNHCGMHDYYDSINVDPSFMEPARLINSYEFTIPTFWQFIKIWFNHKFETRKCSDCKKHDKRLGFNVGDHSNCLPF